MFSNQSWKWTFTARGASSSAIAVSANHPLVLNTGRGRDQWHTMTRTGAVPRLATHAPAPVIYRAFIDPEALTAWLPPNGCAAISMSSSRAKAERLQRGEKRTDA